MSLPYEETPLAKRVEEAEQKALRALADLENMRRRESEARAGWSKQAVVGFVRPLAGKLNALTKGLELEADTPLAEAVRGLMGEMEKEGLTMISPDPGTPVDGHEHEVLLAAEGQPGTVVMVLEPGWKYKDMVCTPAKVSAAPEA